MIIKTLYVKTLEFSKVFSFLLFLSTGLYSQQTGTIRGTVHDSETAIALVGVNVFIENSNVGDATDIDGYFEINNIPVGTQHLQVHMIGYEEKTYLNLLVSQARPIELEISLKPKPIEMGAVEVKGNTFSKSSGATLSTFNVDQAELRSDPVGVYDVQRMVINLPSVSTASDQENEIIARGGLPGENLFLMDGIEISNPNHFGMDGAGGGPVNMVNPLFVREIEFTPGAFSAKYGDKASSVMDVSLRNGSRKSFEYDANVSMAGAGLNIEGPIQNGRGSFLASSNWSYLDLILTSIGLTAVPKYNNHQSKIVYDLDKNNQLTFNTLLGFDAIHIQGGDDVVSRGAESVDHKGNTIVAGIGLRTILNSNSYRKILLSQVFNNYNNIVYDYPDKSNPWYTINNANKETTFKSEWVFNLRWGQLITGAIIKHNNSNYDEWAEADTIYSYDTTYWNGEYWDFPDSIDTPEINSILYAQEKDLDFQIKEGSIKLSNYVQLQFPVGKRTKISTGLRADYFDITDEIVFSPRFNWEFKINQVTTIHGGAGRHYQYPNYIILYVDNEGRNKNMKAKYSDQAVIGLEYLFAYDFKGSIETFYKEYGNIPSKYYWTYTPDENDVELSHRNHWLTEGEARSYGIEFFLQKKLTNNWHWLMSYAWSKSQTKNVQNAFNNTHSIHDNSMANIWIDSEYDFGHQLTLIAGWKSRLWEKQWYRDIRDKWWLNVLGPLNPLADEIEITIRYAYMGGKPYTKKTYHPELFDWTVDEGADWNASRYDSYKRFDIMLLQRYHFETFNIVTFIDFINIFDRNNIWDLSYNQNGTKEAIYQYKTMPIGGVTLEF